MTATLIGTRSIGQCLPIAVSANATAKASLNLQLPSVQAELQGALDVQAEVTVNPPTLATSLQAALGLVAQLEASIALGLPSASIDLSVVAGIVAKLQAKLGSINAQLSATAALDLILGGAAGVHVITADAALDDLGSDIQSVAGGVATGSTRVRGVLLLATTDEVWALLEQAVITS